MSIQEKTGSFNKNTGELGVFLDRRRVFIQPLFETPDQLSEKMEITNEKGLLEVHEAYRTHIYISDKAQQAGLNVLVTVNDPGAWSNAGKVLISELLSDSRFKSVTVMVSGLANQELVKEYVIIDDIDQGTVDASSNKFVEVGPVDIAGPSAQEPRFSIFAGLQSLSEQRPFDLVLTTVGMKDDPGVALNYGGLGNTAYLVSEGWGGLGEAVNCNAHNLRVAAVFCNDHLAESVIRHRASAYTGEILPLGTPAINDIEVHKAQEFRGVGRSKMGIGSDTFAFLYLGDVNADYPEEDYNKDINGVTLEIAFASYKELALSNPGREFAFLFRPHPRNDSNVGMLGFLDNEVDRIPDNLSIVMARGREEGVSMNEAAYAADSLGSIISTESSKAPLRGRSGFFLAFDDPPGIGGEVMRRSYGSEIAEQLRISGSVNIVSSGGEFLERLQLLVNTPKNEEVPAPISPQTINYARVIIQKSIDLAGLG